MAAGCQMELMSNNFYFCQYPSAMPEKKSTPTVRIVTAASLFDGHDAAINIMRRILQAKGAEVIHLGHNRSVHEIVECAIEEDAHAIAITSYQGGHVEFFKYAYDMLRESGCGHIKIVGGGGGTILPAEMEDLHRYGIEKIYSPDDGRRLGLEGMIDDLLKRCSPTKDASIENEYETAPDKWTDGPPLNEVKDIRKIARSISLAEGLTDREKGPEDSAVPDDWPGLVLGITGTGGAGKSSVTDEIVRRFLDRYTDKTIAVISVDPSRKKTGGALLGDRIRMNAISHPRAYMRSMATRNNNMALNKTAAEAINICKAAGFDMIILESAGVGQSDASIVDYCDVSMYVMTPEYGAASQLEKINMLDYADLVCINKFDKPGALDALHDVKKQYRRNHLLWTAADADIPVVGTIAAQFNDAGINNLFEKLMNTVEAKTGVRFQDRINQGPSTENRNTTSQILPAKQVRYLSDIAETIRAYDKWVAGQTTIASQLYRLQGAKELLEDPKGEINEKIETLRAELSPANRALIDNWPQTKETYRKDHLEYTVRGKTIRQPLTTASLSGTSVRKLSLPQYSDWGDILKWQLQENLPGRFPFTAGVFELKRQGEDPTRMFAGEGGPERTNKRFHYLSADQPAKRLSTAFDSVTLYGEDPAYRADIYGKVGNSGVSVATVDDAKKLYSGFDLCDAATSVSMTINGPAPVILAFFLNAAIDQQCEKWIEANGQWAMVDGLLKEKFSNKKRPEYFDVNEPGGHPVFKDTQHPSSTGRMALGLQLLGLSGDEVLPADRYEEIKAYTLSQVRGTVQADILKEDQAQNTCIFSTEFALKLMGDVQEYFIQNNVRNFYSVSISGYHIAEAGANPISQLAFTLANGFTYVEYYLSRGMHIDDFAPNLSFFFSNGMDPEYSVIGRVARRIWAKAMREKYGANERSQKLKYHIQTSGRSLHAQEIDFNDIRTTLQALYAIYDNCNSLHTNAYDEAITTPTEESVRRAVAIQLIINRELGSTRSENFLQGSFAVEELTDLVEAAVLAEFDRINERGGVLGAMERMYQRNKIQEESMFYEMQKNTGELPVIGVNSFLSKQGSPTVLPGEVIRSTEAERKQQIENLQRFKERNNDKSATALEELKKLAFRNDNLFEGLMECVKYCSLGQITQALYEVGGQYRRNM